MQEDNSFSEMLEAEAQMGNISEMHLTVSEKTEQISACMLTWFRNSGGGSGTKTNINKIGCFKA